MSVYLALLSSGIVATIFAAIPAEKGNVLTYYFKLKRRAAKDARGAEKKEENKGFQYSRIENISAPLASLRFCVSFYNGV